MSYGYVEDGEVVLIQSELPKSWKNISGFNNLSITGANEHNWYEIVQDDVTLKDWEFKTESIFTLNGTEIIKSWNISEMSVDDYKIKKLNEIKESFYTELKNGCELTLGFKIDCKTNDLANWTSNYNHMKLKGDTETVIRDYDNNLRTLSLENYEELCIEVGNYSKLLMGKKWQLQNQINLVLTYEEVEAVIW